MHLNNFFLSKVGFNFYEGLAVKWLRKATSVAIAKNMDILLRPVWQSAGCVRQTHVAYIL